MHDVVLGLFTPVNWSILIFSIIYLSIAQTFLSITRYPLEILLGLSTYLAVNLLRIVSMYLLTFEPPADMILLVDPVTSHFYPDGGFAKDLFFSGHVSTMTLMIILEKNRLMKRMKIVLTLVVALLLIWQHVHFTLDILVAPFVTYAVFHSLKWFLKSSPGA
jgi:PAP2 superfamily C-terminal